MSSCRVPKEERDSTFPFQKPVTLCPLMTTLALTFRQKLCISAVPSVTLLLRLGNWKQWSKCVTLNSEADLVKDELVGCNTLKKQNPIEEILQI